MKWLTAAFVFVVVPALHATVKITGVPAPDPFPALPDIGDWTTLQVGAGAVSITPEDFDSKVIVATDASAVFMPLGNTSNFPPSSNVLARWNAGGGTGGFTFLQTKPTGEDYLLLMAHLQNDTGGSLHAINVAYDFSVEGVSPAEEIKGLRAYWSISGVAGSWKMIPALSVESSAPLEIPEKLAATITLSTPLESGGTMFLLWADQNSLGTDASCHLKNFAVSSGVCAISGTVSRLQRNPGLNVNDPSDDKITFDAAFTGTGGVSPAGWIVIAPPFLTGITGTYGSAQTFFSVPVFVFNSGPLELKAADTGIAHCQTSVMVSIPGRDSDGDGVSDADEVLMGTNPNNPSDVLNLSRRNPSQVEFPSKAGRFYRVYTSSNLQTWQDSGLPPIAGDGSTKQFNTSTAGPGRRFYRLQVKTTDGPWPVEIP